MTREDMSIGCPVRPSQTGQASSAPLLSSASTVELVKSGMSTGVKRTRSHLSFK